MVKADQPIGIFDSGVGGLTVAAAIHKALPNENLLYFGDTAHTPWGSQSSSAIQHYASKITETLLQQQCKVIVVACNTASAAALQTVQATVKDRVPIFNVIDPVIAHIARKYQHQAIGLIGTKQTIKSQAYARRLQQVASNIQLNSLATPMLAPLIEEGFSHTAAAEELIGHYLRNPALQNIAGLILGCTHYPLIKDVVAKFFAPHIEILDSAQIVANEVANHLTKDGLLNQHGNAKKTFYVSDDSEFFGHTAQQFFPGDFKLETYPLWD